MTAPYGTIDDKTVMDGFHLFLGKALGQAKAEHLLDEQTLASAESDIMVAGPALCLYFAALRSSTTPPSIPIPRFGLPRDTPPLVLNSETVSPTFRAFFSIWVVITPQIQALPPQQQHDLARLICGHEPLGPAGTQTDALRRMALDLRAVAIEISQRRTFQERYQEDLQTALDHGRPVSQDGRRTPSPLRATFVPPPGYEAEKPLPLSPVESAHPSPRMHSRPMTPTSPTMPSSPRFHLANPDFPDARSSPPRSSGTYIAPHPAGPRHSRTASAQSTSMFLEPPGGGNAAVNLRPVSPSPSESAAGPSGHVRRPSSPSILTPSDPAILTIRETLYAALADVLARKPEVRALLKTDPPRAYFASVGLAILEFSLHSLTPEGNVQAVLGAELRLEDIPRGYKPLMQELQAIATRTRQLEAEDDQKAIELLTAGEDTLPEPRMDRVQRMLVVGVARGWEELQQQDGTVAPADTDVMSGAAFESQQRRSGRDPTVSRGRSRDRSPEGTVLHLVNRINALALGMTRLPAFRERERDVFKVLAGVR